MKLKLTPWTVFLGILLFCKELIYTVCLRLTLVGYVAVISFLIFPLFAGLLFNLLILTIPLSYFLYAQPAFILAIALSAIMIIFNRHVLNRKSAFIIFSILMAPCAVVMGIKFCDPSYTPPWIITMVEDFFSYKVDENPSPMAVNLLLGGIMLFAIVITIMGTLLGGGLVASALNEKILQTLLVPPKSVKKQLLAY
jgi:hypothetical protein